MESEWKLLNCTIENDVVTIDKCDSGMFIKNKSVKYDVYFNTNKIESYILSIKLQLCKSENLTSESMTVLNPTTSRLTTSKPIITCPGFLTCNFYMSFIVDEQIYVKIFNINLSYDKNVIHVNPMTDDDICTHIRVENLKNLISEFNILTLEFNRMNKTMELSFNDKLIHEIIFDKTPIITKLICIFVTGLTCNKILLNVIDQRYNILSLQNTVREFMSKNDPYVDVANTYRNVSLPYGLRKN